MNLDINMKCINKFLFLCILAIIFNMSNVTGLQHHLDIKNDDRSMFKIETFGFVKDGQLTIRVQNMHLTRDLYKDHVLTNSSHSSSNSTITTSTYKHLKAKLGFVMRKSTSESKAQEDLERIVENKSCLLDQLKPDDLFINMSDPKTWQLQVTEHEFRGTGLYSFVFVRCEPKGSRLVSFHLDAEFYNPGPNYLSAGDLNLPTVYFSMFILFSVMMLVWIYVLLTARRINATVHRIHWMMLLLLVFKCMTLLSESIRYHYIAAVGASELWSIVYFVFAFLKGIMLFTVILLIGSGWSLMKSYLNEREKRIIMVVLTLQVIDNIAMVVLEETSPGSKVWLAWRDILHFVDITCCCVILFPIVWSINHLQQAATADGKASGNLHKLHLFREFYVTVVVYIYFTRIVVYLLSASLRFDRLWLGDLTTEGATFLFYLITGYKFRPAPDNPYIEVAREDQHGFEYGLEDEDIESEVHVKDSGGLELSNGVAHRT